jgi:preprotein translocase subunit YajC
MTGIAFAADAATGAAGMAGGFTSFIPLILIFVVFYFLLIRPQQKQAKQHQQFLSELKKGSKVVTKGGIHGLITAINDNIITLEIAKDINIKVSRDAIAGGLSKEGVPVAETKDSKSGS